MLLKFNNVMNTLLVYPAYPDTFWSFKHVLPFISKKAAFPPLGLLTVAAMLPADWNKRLVDVNVSDLLDADLAWADLVLISAMLVQEKSAREVIQRAKALGKRVVAGGPAFSAQHERFEGVDHFVLNEAESTLPIFIEDLRRGDPKPVYSSAERPDITATPLPLWGLIDFKDYVSMSVQYSRGCPYDCEFCDIVVMNGRIPRVKTPEQMIREFQHLYDAGWRGAVFVVDDNFIGNKAQVKKLLPLLIAWQAEHGFPYKLMTEASINLALDNELMSMMSAANFHKVFIGIETPSLDSLKECGKVQNVTVDFAKAVQVIHQNGMQVMGGFIVGFDSDTETIFERQIRFIQEIGVVSAMVGVLNAVPKTRLWHRLQAENRLLGESSGDNTDGSTNFVPVMGRDMLREGYKHILATIYSPKHYYKRINTLLASYNPTARGRVLKGEVKVFLKSLWGIGVLSGARFAYWKLMLKTAMTKRKAFAVAVELAICGRHYERVAKRVLEAE